MSITQLVCEVVALGTKHAMSMRHTVICGMPCSAIHFHIISQTARFSKKKIIQHKICFEYLYNFYLKHFSF